MRRGVWLVLAAAVELSAHGSKLHAASVPFDLGLSDSPQAVHIGLINPPRDPSVVTPFFLAQVDDPPNVYPEIMPSGEEQQMNSGGVSVGLEVDWLTDYVFRGIDQNTPGRRPENALQFDVNATFDLGKLPHPFIGLFVNVFNTDPISRFEEVRPYFGLDWNLRPFDMKVGFNAYIHPNRKSLDTQEVFSSVTLDDSMLFNTVKPVFSPYVYGAYDSDLYRGFYIEAGLQHDFEFEDIGLTLTPKGDVAYVVNDPFFEGLHANPRNYGLQHFDTGLTGTYSLNHLFNVNHRYGEWDVKGYLFYTAGIDKRVRSDTLIWGGVGLEFKY
jgi:hypothetical protein